jgi:hypothetical protein
MKSVPGDDSDDFLIQSKALGLSREWLGILLVVGNVFPYLVGAL